MFIMQHSWSRHPGVRSVNQLTMGERAADAMRNGLGTWTFVFIFLVVMALWVVVNSVLLIGGPHGFDKYPYVLLNLILSTIAGLQGATLLIAAKRADQIASEVALHTYQNTEGIKTLIQQNTELTQKNNELTEAVRTIVDTLVS